jgi:mannose-6-phosphate isomerase-like protein (cupin superfamily)
MYLVANNSPARSSVAELVGAGDVAAHWLIDEECSGATLGKIGLIEIGSRGSARLTPHAGCEHMLFVLHGRGHVRCNSVDADVHEESVIFLPGGETLELQPRHAAARLLLIQGGRAAASAGMQITSLERVENVPFHRPELGFIHVAARWLVGANAAKSSSLVVGQSTFIPGAAHLLHRHDHANEFFYVFEGRGAHLVDGGEVAMQAGDVVFAPRGEWHGFRNTDDRPVRAIFGYFGVTSLEEAGYEVHAESKMEH